MFAQALRRLDLGNDLRRAIEQGELRLSYQPKVLLGTDTITGVEALVRWEHPERGLILPDEFIPLAEETGAIVPLGWWVLREACRRAREWGEQYPPALPLGVSVNVSGKQFQEADLVRGLAGILQEVGLEPSRLQLEITESVVMADTEYAADMLRGLKGLGVKIAVDDFGTGYSSLSFLRRFPLDELKIDKEFVDGLGRSDQDEAIVRLVIDLSHALGLEAVAEGVETAEQLARLREMGCDQAQGYYFWESLRRRSGGATSRVFALAAQPPWSDWSPSKSVGAPPKSERCRFEHGDTLAGHGYRPLRIVRRAREMAPIKPAGSAAYLVQTDAV
jgi:EAL domain-containing protein (putative c-di-GMP-specific phosphodiesterase class I)